MRSLERLLGCTVRLSMAKRHDGSEDKDAQRAPGRTALLLIDVINPLDFVDADALAPSAFVAADRIRRLRDDADRLGVPVVYVNDNYGHWTSEREKIITEIRAASAGAERLVAQLAPRPHDYFVIKPQVSGFYATNLPVLLPRLGASRTVLAGFALDICVLFTAADAHMRDYDLWIPRDAVAGAHSERTTWALEILEHSFGAETAPTGELSLQAWINRG
jgi:nicotinamidase-related amidase